ncbi:hypothetical protein LCGC14_1604600 [marine sediment metagenome]|uniref:Uncharacterized protein n=1 Tax=marine sediment metagenome TaxID=412755 RepID=A0A0F9KQW0_9ZZZZ
MITTSILFILFAALSVLFLPIKLLPNASLPEGLSDAINTAGQYLAGINTILPLTTLFTIFGFFLVIELSIFVYKLIMWAIKKIPTIN